MKHRTDCHREVAYLNQLPLMTQRRHSCIAANYPRFDHLVGAGKQRRWDREAERLRGSCVDYQLELEALLDKEVSRLGVLENPSGVGPACRYKSTNSSGHRPQQTPGVNKSIPGRGPASVNLDERSRPCILCRERVRNLGAAPGSMCAPTQTCSASSDCPRSASLRSCAPGP